MFAIVARADGTLVPPGRVALVVLDLAAVQIGAQARLLCRSEGGGGRRSEVWEGAAGRGGLKETHWVR